MLKKEVGLISVLFFAFIFRVWGIGFGLPGIFHIDENFFPYNAIYALSHKLHIATLLYGNLLPYLLGLLYMGYFSLLWIVGIVHSPAEFLIKYYYEDPTALYLIGKLTMVIFSTLTVWLIYQIGKKLFNIRTALIGAIFLATAFLWVAETKVMKGDIPGTFFIFVSLYFLTREKDKPNVRNSVLGGVFWGLAMGARYYFVSFLIPVLLFYLVCIRRRQIIPLVRFVGVGIISFLLVTPSFFLQFSNVVFSISREIQIQTKAPWIDPGNYPIWLYFLLVHLRQGIGTIFLLFSLIGGLYVLIRRNLYRIVLLISFPAIYFVLLNNTTNFARYSLPLIPFFSLLSANLLDNLATYIKIRPHRYCLIGGLVLLSVYPNLLNIVKYNYLISQVDIRLIAKEWIEEYIPSGAKIVNEGGENYKEISQIGVPLHKESSLIEKRREEAIKRGTPGRSFSLIRKANETRKAVYNVRNVLQVDTIERYVEEDVEYVVMVSWARREPLPLEIKEPLTKNYELIKIFLPNPVFRWDMYCFQLDYQALKRVSIFDKDVHPGPIVEIYRRKCS